MPDHPNTVVKRLQAIAAANDERRLASPSRVIWNGSIDSLEGFRSYIKDHCGQISAGYLFDAGFLTAYLKKGVHCYVDFLDAVPFESQVEKDICSMYGALLRACQGGVGWNILMENRNKYYGIRSGHCISQLSKMKQMAKVMNQAWGGRFQLVNSYAFLRSCCNP
jgi:hypothetical protein